MHGRRSGRLAQGWHYIAMAGEHNKSKSGKVHRGLHADAQARNLKAGGPAVSALTVTVP